MIHLEVLTAESSVVSTDVDSVVATTMDGQVGILHGHVPLVTVLQPGELVLRTGEREAYLAVSGGFLRVTPRGIIVLADACEYAEEIDVNVPKRRNVGQSSCWKPVRRRRMRPLLKQHFVVRLPAFALPTSIASRLADAYFQRRDNHTLRGVTAWKANIRFPLEDDEDRLPATRRAA